MLKNYERYQPLGHRVLVKFDAAKAVSEGGIILPDTTFQPKQNATVMLLGTAAEFVVKPGDRVVLSKGGSTPIPAAGPDMAIVNQEFILGIISR